MEPRPETIYSSTTKIPTGYGMLYVTITELESRPFEVFCTIGKSGGSIMAKAEVIGRLVSLALRNGVNLIDIIDQLIDISDDRPVLYGKQLTKSIPDAVGQLLRDKYLNKPVTKKNEITSKEIKAIIEEDKNAVQRTE